MGRPVGGERGGGRGGAGRAAGRGSAPAAVAAVAATVVGGGGEPWFRRPWLLGTLDWRRRLLVRRGARPAFQVGTERLASRAPPGKFAAERRPPGRRGPA